MIKGRTWSVRATVWLDKSNGIYADLTGSTYKAIFKANPKDLDANALLTLTTQISVIDPATALVELTLTPAQTLLFNSLNRIFFEITYKLSDSKLLGTGIAEEPVLGNVLATPY